MTYDNPYFALLGGGGGRNASGSGAGSDGGDGGRDEEAAAAAGCQDGGVPDAMARARLMRNVIVLVGDMCGDEAVGHVALTSCLDVWRMAKGRQYA